MGQSAEEGREGSSGEKRKQVLEVSLAGDSHGDNLMIMYLFPGLPR